MQRDLGRLRAAALLLASDLNRTLGPGWSCTVDDEFVLTIEGPSGSESSALSPDIEDEDWYVVPEASAEEQSAGLDADAEEAVAEEALEILDVLGVAWPKCPEHGARVSVCEGVWLCAGKPEHDLALVGHLGG